MTDEEKLAAFEEVLAQAVFERAQIEEKMADLREKGKSKSVTYQQYFAMRHELDSMLGRFKERGLL